MVLARTPQTRTSFQQPERRAFYHEAKPDAVSVDVYVATVRRSQSRLLLAIAEHFKQHHYELVASFCGDYSRALLPPRHQMEYFQMSLKTAQVLSRLMQEIKATIASDWPAFMDVMLLKPRENLPLLLVISALAPFRDVRAEAMRTVKQEMSALCARAEKELADNKGMQPPARFSAAAPARSEYMVELVKAHLLMQACKSQSPYIDFRAKARLLKHQYPSGLPYLPQAENARKNQYHPLQYEA
jgi:hypothetical protein